MSEKDPSRLRQRLRQNEELRSRHVEDLLAERGPVVAGSFVRQPIRCGRPGCKCARGEPHAGAALYLHLDGRHVCRYVPQADRQRVERMNRGYKRLRSARASLVKASQQALALVDALQEALTEPYLPSPPTSREARQRKPRKKGASS